MKGEMKEGCWDLSGQRENTTTFFSEREEFVGTVNDEHR